MEIAPNKGVKRKFYLGDWEEKIPDKHTILNMSLEKLQIPPPWRKEAPLLPFVLIRNTVIFMEKEIAKDDARSPTASIRETPEISLSQSMQGSLPGISTFISPLISCSPGPVAADLSSEGNDDMSGYLGLHSSITNMWSYEQVTDLGIGSLFDTPTEESVTELLSCGQMNYQDSSLFDSQGDSPMIELLPSTHMTNPQDSSFLESQGDAHMTELLPIRPLTHTQDSSFFEVEGHLFPKTGQTSSVYPYSTVHSPIPSSSPSSYDSAVQLDPVIAASMSLEMPFDTPLLDSQSASSHYYTNPSVTSAGEAGDSKITSQGPDSNGPSPSDADLSVITNDPGIMDFVMENWEKSNERASSSTNSEQSSSQPSVSQQTVVNTPCSTYCCKESSKDSPQPSTSQQAVVNTPCSTYCHKESSKDSPQQITVGN